MDNNKDVLIANKYSLSEKTLTQLCEQIEKQTGFHITWQSVEKGYIFKDEIYGIAIGDLKYKVVGGEYDKIQLYPGAISDVKERLIRRQTQPNPSQPPKSKKIGKYALQVGCTLALAVALTTGGISALRAIGVIDSPNKPHEPSVGITAEIEETPINTLENCNDVILIEWLNYAMSQVDDSCRDSQYDYIQTLRQEVYSQYYVPAMSSYYNYLDYNDAALPYEDTNLAGKSHDSFRQNAYTMTKYLASSDYFKDIRFETSPYAYAIVTDTEGNILTESETISGEVLDANGNPINAADSPAVVNIRANDITNANYSLDNLPPDVKVINGAIYVSSIHLKDEHNKTM